MDAPKIRLKIVSDGTSKGTRVVRDDTGEEIAGVRSIEWSIMVHNFAVARIEVIGVAVDVVSDVNTFEGVD